MDSLNSLVQWFWDKGFKFGPFFIGLVALGVAFLRPFLDYFNRPKLDIKFDCQHESYCRKLASGYFTNMFMFKGYLLSVHIPFFSSRIKVINRGNTTARRVQARIEKIELIKDHNRPHRTIYYHPTQIKWSGELDWSDIDIIPHSHFFLDLFWSKNETPEQIIASNLETYEMDNIYIPYDALSTFINAEHLSNAIFWNVWVKQPHVRGIPESFSFEGTIHLYINLAAENCKPQKYIAKINWKASSWSNPEINIERKRIWDKS